MPEKFRDRYRINSARAPWWDYASDAAYFITICTRDRQHYFGEITDGKMQLSNIGIIANLMWYEIKNHAKDCQLGEFVVMPDHVHGILILNKDELSNESPKVETRHALSLPLAIETDPIETGPENLSPAQSRFQNQGKGTISSIVGSYKSVVTKHAHRLGFEFAWQARFHDHIIRNENEFEKISKYIRRNPENYDNEDSFDTFRIG
jgi:REP element-mobilizing transposase RayT